MIKLANDEKYVTYFPPNKHPFDSSSITINIGGARAYVNKPDCAFWGSPNNAQYGWKEWCKDNDFGEYEWNKLIVWKLKSGTKILEINWEDVISQDSILEKYTYCPYKNLGLNFMLRERALDFFKLLEDGISAVHLTDGSIGHRFLADNPYEMMFNSWDCDSIVVLDKTKILFE